KVEFRSIFYAPSRKFKILAIPNVLAHRKSYEHGFMKKHDNHTICTKSRVKSSFDRFFVHLVRNSKIQAIPNVLAYRKSYEHGFVKNATVVNFA
ncbi:hypothetical protein B296_00033875, partial [Ensete ventricosum]